MDRSDIIRSLLHLSGMGVPVVVGGIGKTNTLLIIGVLSTVYIFSEFIRPRGRRLPIIGELVSIARKESTMFETAPLFFALGVSLALIAFRQDVSFASIAVVSLGDSTAKLGGKAFGRHRLPFGRVKTLEGSLSGLVFAFIGSSLFLPLELALVCSSVGMLVEALPLRVDDNLLMPLSSALAVTGLMNML